MTLLADNSVESVDGISGVVDDTTGAIGFQEAVLSLDDISVAGLVLVLNVSGYAILNSVREAVLRVGIVALVFLVDQLGLSVGLEQRSLQQTSSVDGGEQSQDTDVLGRMEREGIRINCEFP